MLYRLDLIDNQAQQSQHQCEAESDRALCRPGAIHSIDIDDLGDDLKGLPLVTGSQYGRTWPAHLALQWHQEGKKSPTDQPYWQEAEGDSLAHALHVYVPTPLLRDRIAAIEADGRKIVRIEIREAF